MAKTNSTDTVEKLLSDSKLDPKLRRYGRACIDGEKQAELYLHELRLKPELIGMPLMSSYIKKIRPYPKDPRIRGLLVGFFGRVEQEFARLITEDIWRAATWSQKWAIARKLSESVTKLDDYRTKV